MDKWIEAVDKLPPSLRDHAVKCFHKTPDKCYQIIDAMDKSRFKDCDYAFVVGMVVGYLTAKKS